MKIGLREAAKAEQMVVEEVGVLGQWLQSFEVTPDHRRCAAGTEDIKRRRWTRVLARMPHLSSDDRAAAGGTGLCHCQ